MELDINEMKLEHKQQQAEPEWTFKQLLASKQLRLPLMLVCALACSQQLSGINVVCASIPVEYSLIHPLL